VFVNARGKDVLVRNREERLLFAKTREVLIRINLAKPGAGRKITLFVKRKKRFRRQGG
jgi:hypothetical protein